MLKQAPSSGMVDPRGRKRLLRCVVGLVAVLACVAIYLRPTAPRNIKFGASLSPRIDPREDTEWPVLFAVQVDDKDGYIDASGRIVIPPQFDQAFTHFIGRYTVASRPGEYLKGYIDRSGNWHIEPKYAVAYPFREGAAVVATENGWGLINEQDEFIVEPIHDRTQGFENGVAAIGTETLTSRLHRRGADVGSTFDWIYFDRTGRVIPEGEALRLRTENGAACSHPTLRPKQIGGRYGIVNESGEVIVKPTFDCIREFAHGLAPAQSNGKWGYIDKSGSYVIQPRFDSARAFEHDEKVAIVKKDGKFGMIDVAGSWVVQPTVDWGGEIAHGLSWVTQNKRVGYINTRGEWVWKPTR